MCHPEGPRPRGPEHAPPTTVTFKNAPTIKTFAHTRSARTRTLRWNSGRILAIKGSTRSTKKEAALSDDLFLSRTKVYYPFILSKNSLLLLVPSILLRRNSIASTELSGLSTRRSAHTFCITSGSRRRSSLRVPDALRSMAG